MNFGSLAGGLAEGLQGGYRTGMLAENLRGQREMDQRRVGIMEANAQQQRELADLQKQQHQRQLDRETRAEEAHKRAIGALIEGTDAPLDRNASAGSQIGQVILSTNALNDPRRLRAALNIYREAGMAKEAEEYLGHLKNAQEQNVLPALDALKKGDYEGASQIYSQMGIKARFSPGSTKGKYRVDYDGDGSHEERDLDLDEMSVRGYTGFQKAKQAALDAANKAETHKAEIELKQADAANKRGDNPTKIRVAEIGAQKALDVADRRANRKGGGKGGAGGDDGEVDWKDAKARHDINADIMNAAVAQFSKTPLDPVSGKKAPDEYSRNLGEKASRVYLKALEGGRPMTIESSLRIANEGQVTYATKLDSSGRLMTKPGISLNGTVYDDGSVEKPATKQQVIEYLDSTRARAVEKGTQITADMLKDVPIDKWAKQAGMKPQELIDRLVSGPPTPKGEQAGGEPASKGSGGIVSSAQAQETGARPARGSGVASESADVSKAKDLDRRIQALEARGDLLPESAKKQLADLKAQRKGTGISSAQIQAADLQGEIRNLEEAIVRLKKTDTGFDKRRSEQIKRLEAQRDQMRARLGGAATSGISREQMR